MKKKLFRMLTGLILSCSLAGSSTVMAQEADSSDTVKSYLTGEDVPASIGRRRPVAVMLGNDRNGAPQSGLTNAGVIYEAPVEGQITRLIIFSMPMNLMPFIRIMDRLLMHFLILSSMLLTI